MAASRRPARPLRAGRSRLTLGICVLLSLVLLTLDYRGSGAVDRLRGGALDALAPVRRVVERATRPATDAWQGATGYDDLEAENAALRAQLDELQRRLLDGQDRDERYEELLDLLDVGNLGDLDLVAARVVAPSPSNFDLTVELDVGRGDGVAEGNPVVAGGGLLVGTVVRAGESRAVVRLVSDPAFRVGVTLPATTTAGTLHGAGRGEQPTVEHVEASVPAEVGDVVRTSGEQGSRFPPDLLIGTVSEVVRTPGGPELRLRVAPAADLEGLSYVQVVRWSPGS